MILPNKRESSLFTIEEIAKMAADDYNNIVQFIIEDRIPYVAVKDGILIPFGGFQMCMPDLYDLAEAFREFDDLLAPEE